MAKKKQSAEMEEKIRIGDDAYETGNSLIQKFQNNPSLSKNDISDLKNNLDKMRKIRDGFYIDGQYPMSVQDIKKKLEIRGEEVKKLLASKSKLLIDENDKKVHIENIKKLMATLDERANELKVQIENLGSKKKGKSQAKVEKYEKYLENISGHMKQLELIFLQGPINITVSQEEGIKDILSFWDNYLENRDYTQPTLYVDAIYPAFDVMETIPQPTQAQPKELPKEIEAKFNLLTEKFPDKLAADKKVPPVSSPNNNTNTAQKTVLEPVRRKMPVLTEKDFKGEYNFFEIFEASARNVPADADSWPTEITKKKIEQKSVFPKRKIVDEQLFEKLELDTLFFIFYFEKGTYEQYLAAKNLKKRAWRFHKKYLTWFKRLEAPKITNDDYEQGTYAFFDFEPNGWCQRKKNDFTFKYSYLEDEKM